MLNSSTVQGRQTQMSTRRAVGAQLLPMLVRLAECADDDLAVPARATVLALYGDKVDAQTRAALVLFTKDELETMLDVMTTRRVSQATVPGYLALYLGPQASDANATFSLAGMDALAMLRDGGTTEGASDIAGRVLRLDMLGKLSEPCRSFILRSSFDSLRAICDEAAEHDAPDSMLLRVLEMSCH